MEPFGHHYLSNIIIKKEKKSRTNFLPIIMTLNVRREIFESSSSSPFPGLDILAILYLLKSLLYLKLLCYQQHLSSAEIGLVVACFVFLAAVGILAFAAANLRFWQSFWHFHFFQHLKKKSYFR